MRLRPPRQHATPQMQPENRSNWPKLKLRSRRLASSTWNEPFLILDLVPRHSDYDWLILSQSRMGKSSGATRIWMLRATPG